MASTSAGSPVEGAGPRNIVAILHASFHPTKGNTLDWSLTSPSSPQIDLSGIEFTVLPSGLHLVPQDVVYFTHNVRSPQDNTSRTYTGLAIFRRRPTKDVKHHRGFRLSSLGVLFEESERPRPWMHLEALRSLADELYREPGRRERESEAGAGRNEEECGVDLLGLGLGAPGDLRESDFECARKWFQEHEASAGTSEKYLPIDVWSGWSDELDGSFASKNTPTHHLPHLLRILGLSSLTLYKFVLARRRILIYTLPPVEVAGVLAWAAADMCREHHMSPRSASAFGSSKAYGVPMPDLFASSSKSTKAEALEDERLEHPPSSSPLSPTVLGMISLNDIPRLEHASSTGKGWIACTTDAIFLEKPQYYDLVIDLTTCTPSRASRPALFMTRAVGGSGVQGEGGGRRREKWKLESVRFTWSDVKLWNELDRILKLDSSQASSHAHSHPSGGGACCSPKSPSFSSSGLTAGGAGVWADAFKLYEDVCLLCASLWMGLGTWRSNSRQSFASRDVYDVDFDNDMYNDLQNNNRSTSAKKKTRENLRAWGSARAPGDEDWSLEGTMGTNVKMRMVGAGIEGQPSPSPSSSPSKKKDKGKEGEAKIRAVGLGIEGRPSLGSGNLKGRSRSRSGHGYGHGRKASGSSMVSAMKIPTTGPLIEVANETENQDQQQDLGDDRAADRQGDGLTEEDAEELRMQQNIQTTLALLQTFHANTVFWLSKLREMIPPPSPSSHSPSYPGSPGSPSPAAGLTSGIGYTVTAPGSTKGIRLPSDESERGNYQDEEDESGNETITITARDLLSLELGVLSELDAKFVEWLVEAEGYTLTLLTTSSATTPASARPSGQQQMIGTGIESVRNDGAGARGRKKKVVVKRGWQELFGILLGLK